MARGWWHKSRERMAANLKAQRAAERERRRLERESNAAERARWLAGERPPRPDPEDTAARLAELRDVAKRGKLDQ